MNLVTPACAAVRPPQSSALVHTGDAHPLQALLQELADYFYSGRGYEKTWDWLQSLRQLAALPDHAAPLCGPADLSGGTAAPLAHVDAWIAEYQNGATILTLELYHFVRHWYRALHP